MADQTVRRLKSKAALAEEMGVEFTQDQFILRATVIFLPNGERRYKVNLRVHEEYGFSGYDQAAEWEFEISGNQIDNLVHAVVSITALTEV